MRLYSVADSCSGVGVLYFIGNILLLKLLILFSLAQRDNPMLFRKDLFSTGFTPLSIPFNALTTLPCSLSALSNVNLLSCISLTKTIGNAYLLKS